MDKPDFGGGQRRYNNAPPPPPNQPRELKVEDALLYLDQVKVEFGDRPRIYNEFLEIMKNFKSNCIDTPGVINRVRTLFKGYNKLILGFNTFLPDGYKIEIADLLNDLPSQPQYPQAAQLQESHERPHFSNGDGKLNGAQFSSSPVERATEIPSNGNVHPGFPQKERVPESVSSNEVHLPPVQRSRQAPPPPKSQRQPPPPPPPPQQQQQQQQQQPVEFDHAISYVTTIKKRFANSPQIYQSFLEILHTYQKEQKGIREVLEQVAELFADHPDLLKQFTYFLPDAVQEQAKERLYKAAHESELRLAHRDQQVQRKRVIDLVTPNNPLQPKETKPGKIPKSNTTCNPEQAKKWVYNASVERQFFDTVKEALVAGSRDGNVAWAGFLRCLDMYSQEQLTREEMLACVEDLLGKRHAHLLTTFKQILHYVGNVSVPGKTTNPAVDDVWYSVPLAEIDFARCRKCTPSYRALPRDYPVPPCSARNEDNAKVLNNTWVSLPVGSEESYTFRHMRRNVHEESLFKIEDERFEIDMVIDSNASTLAKLGELLSEIDLLKSLNTVKGSSIVYNIPKDYFNTIHKHCIQRIYGSDYGVEMFKLIHQNPLRTVEIVHDRLKQKDKEWRNARALLDCQWKSTQEQNWTRSLDHRSLTYKTHDRRLTSTRSLLAEIRDFAANNGEEGAESRNTRREKAKEEYGSFYEVTMPEKAKYPPPPPVAPSRGLNVHLGLNFESQFIEEAYQVIIFGVERGTAAPADKERIHRVFRDFLGDFFGIPPSKLNSVDKNSCYMKSYSVGCGVATLYGIGKVTAVNENESMTVSLPFGTAYLHSSQSCVLYPTIVQNEKTRLLPKVAIGGQPLYLFVRLFQLLCSRLSFAKTSARSSSTYEAFVNALYVLLDCKDVPHTGNAEVGKYEERIRYLLGRGAYALLNMDKLIHHIIKHLIALSLSFTSSTNIISFVGSDTSKACFTNESLSPLYLDPTMRSNIDKYKAAASAINTNGNQENLFLVEVNRHEKCVFFEYLGTGVPTVSDTDSMLDGSNPETSEDQVSKKLRKQ